MQRTVVAAVGLVLAWLATSMSAQQPGESAVFGGGRPTAAPTQSGPAQSGQPASEARGSIAGIVTAAATGAPVRGATVRATFGSGDAAPQTAVTDDNGAFQFTGLTAGSWRVSASKPGFVPRNYGQRGPSGSGSILTVTDRRAVTANIALVRAGAVTGFIFDGFGDPAVGVRVQALQMVATENGRRLFPAGTPDTTDDRGAYRIYGLLPGDYIVAARSASPFDVVTFTARDRVGSASFGVPSGERLLVSRDGMGVTSSFSGPSRRGSTYYPGTSEVSSADGISLGAGDERSGVDFALVDSPIIRLAGTIVNASGERPAGAVMVSLHSDSPDQSATFALTSPAFNGTFDFRDLSPGAYILTAAIPGARLEMAEMPLRLTDDLTGLEIVTAPAVTLRGTVASDDGAQPPSLQGMTVRALPISGQRPGPGATSGAVIDGTFQVPNLLGTFRLSTERIPAGWILKAIELDGIDVTDSAVTFKPGERPEAAVVLTNRLTELRGFVTDDNRSPVEAEVFVFPDDQAKWTLPRFARVLNAREDGRFSVRGLPAHDRYLAVATDYIDPNEVRDPDFLERIRPAAVSFPLEGGQSRNINLLFVERSRIDAR